MDPVTTALLLAQGVAGLGKAGFGASQAAQGRQALDQAYEAPTGKPKEYAEMLKQARASDLAQRRLDEINRSMASSTAALQQAGSRAVIGGIGSVTEAGSRATTGALSQQQAEIMRALQANISGAENERSRQIARENRERAAAQAAISAGIQNIAGGLGDIGKAAALGLDARSGNKTTVNSELDSDLGIGNTPTTDINTNLSTSGSILEEERKKIEQEIYGQDYPGQIVSMKMKNGGVQKTPGAFSHKSNPIDIMQDGAKIGEMTGGEYIFNPTQAKEMQQLSKSGSSPLHKFVRSLLNKPQFK